MCGLASCRCLCTHIHCVAWLVVAPRYVFRAGVTWINIQGCHGMCCSRGNSLCLVCAKDLHRSALLCFAEQLSTQYKTGSSSQVTYICNVIDLGYWKVDEVTTNSLYWWRERIIQYTHVLLSKYYRVQWCVSIVFVAGRNVLVVKVFPF